jgi:hypothetical protein
MTVEWRRKPLKSLKTDPEMASRSITRMPHEIESRGGALNAPDQTPVSAVRRYAATCSAVGKAD